MIYLVLSLAVLLFVFCMDRFRVIEKVRAVIGISHEARLVIGSREFTDEQKESRVQQAAIRVLSLFFSITLRVAGTVLVPAALVYLVSLTGVYSIDEVLAGAINPVFILLSTIVMIVLLYVMQ